MRPSANRIRQQQLAAAALIAAVMTTGSASSARAESDAPYPPAAGTVRVSATSVEVGDCVNVAYDGFGAGTPVAVLVDGVPVDRLSADQRGSMRAAACFGQATPGQHVVTVVGVDALGTSRTPGAVIEVRRVSTSAQLRSARSRAGIGCALGLVATLGLVGGAYRRARRSVRTG